MNIRPGYNLQDYSGIRMRKTAIDELKTMRTYRNEPMGDIVERWIVEHRNQKLAVLPPIEVKQLSTPVQPIVQANEQTNKTEQISDESAKLTLPDVPLQP